MAAHNWELVRDLNLAKCAGKGSDIERLEAEIKASQETCSPHVPNPERPERCYKCGAPPAVSLDRPGPVKARRRPLEIKRVVNG